MKPNTKACGIKPIFDINHERKTSSSPIADGNTMIIATKTSKVFKGGELKSEKFRIGKYSVRFITDHVKVIKKSNKTKMYVLKNLNGVKQDLKKSNVSTSIFVIETPPC